MRQKESIELWDMAADEWARFADHNEYRLYQLIPATLDLVGEVRGLSVLDIGCGEGGYARLLARRGADMTAVDASPRMIEIAKERATAEGTAIEHRVMDSTGLRELQDGSFDIVVAAMSLMLSAQDYGRAVAEVHRVLKIDGKLVMSLTHPCFSSRGVRWVRDEGGNPDHFAVDNYFDTTPWMAHMATQGFSQDLVFHHLPLEGYFRPLLGLGFRLETFREPLASAEDRARFPRLARQERVPGFLMMVWRK